MKFAAEVIDHHVAVLDQLLDRAGPLAAGQLDAPIDIQGPGIDASPTIRSLLSRLVAQLEMWGAAMASRPDDFAIVRDETIDSLRERLRRIGPEFAGYVRAVCEGDRFGETFVDATGESPYVFTAAGMIAHVLTYAAYRRTVLVSALAAAGAGRRGRRPAQLVRPIDRWSARGRLARTTSSWCIARTRLVQLHILCAAAHSFS